MHDLEIVYIYMVLDALFPVDLKFLMQELHLVHMESSKLATEHLLHSGSTSATFILSDRICILSFLV